MSVYTARLWRVALVNGKGKVLISTQMVRSRSAFRSYLRALRSQYGVALCPSMASTTRTVNIPIAIVVDKPTTKIKSSCTYITSKTTVVLLIASLVVRGFSQSLLCLV